MLAGLRDLVDFLPASLATIISYFSAEVTRGIWKSVPMNGIDWPSPQAILLSVESEIKEILVAVGVNIPSCSYGINFLLFSFVSVSLCFISVPLQVSFVLVSLCFICVPLLQTHEHMV